MTDGDTPFMRVSEAWTELNRAVPDENRADLCAVLDDKSAVRALAAAADDIDAAANGDLDAAKRLVRLLPNSTSLRLALRLAESFNRMDMFDAQTSQMLQWYGPMLHALAAWLRQSPQWLDVMEALPLRLGQVIRDVDAGKLDVAMLDRVLAGSPRPNDLQALARYLAAHAGGTFRFDPNALPFRPALPYGLTVADLKQVSISADKIAVDTKNGFVARDGVFSVSVGKHFELELRGSHARLSTWRALWFPVVDLHIGAPVVDVLLKLLMTVTLVLPVLMVYSACTGGITVDVYDDKIQAKVLWNTQFEVPTHGALAPPKT